jgi:hypothetical protein
MFRVRPVHVGFKSAEDDAWPWLPRLPATAQTGDAAGSRSAPHREVLGTNSIRHDSRFWFTPVHGYARFMSIHDC